MQKCWKTLLIACVGLLLLSACSDKKESEKEDTPEAEEENDAEETAEDPQETEEVEDQLELSIGDTGVFKSSLGTYEMTVHEAELLGKKFEGVESARDNIILLNITIENTSNEQLLVDEIMADMEITDDLDEAGSGDTGIGFDSTDPLKGSLEAGQEMTGHFLTTVNKSKRYYFRLDPDVVKDIDSNQVIWEIQKKDLKK